MLAFLKHNIDRACSLIVAWTRPDVHMIKNTIKGLEIGDIPNKSAIRIAGTPFDDDSLVVVDTVHGKRVFQVKHVWLEIEAYPPPH